MRENELIKSSRSSERRVVVSTKLKKKEEFSFRVREVSKKKLSFQTCLEMTTSVFLMFLLYISSFEEGEREETEGGADTEVEFNVTRECDCGGL